MLYVREAQGSVEEVTKKLEAAATENKFGVLGFHDLKQTMNAKGVELQALIAYKRSILNLQNALCTLLESNDFEVIKSVPRGLGKFQFR